MYRLSQSIKGWEVQSVIRLSDGAAIPFDADNTDYQEYLKWIALGNTPQEAE